MYIHLITKFYINTRTIISVINNGRGVSSIRTNLFSAIFYKPFFQFCYSLFSIPCPLNCCSTNFYYK